MREFRLGLIGLFICACTNKVGINPSIIKVFFQSESNQNTFVFDAKLLKDGSILVFNTFGNNDFFESPNFGFSLIGQTGNLVWDTTINSVLPKDKIGFPSYISQSDDSTFIMAWNLTDGPCFILTLLLNNQNKIKDFTFLELFGNDTRFDTLSRNYTLHQIARTSSGYALQFLGTTNPNFSVQIVETDKNFRSVLSPTLVNAFDPSLFFNEYLPGTNLPQSAISNLDLKLHLLDSKNGYFYYCAPYNQTESFALFSTQSNEPVVAGKEFDVLTIALSREGFVNACLSYKEDNNFNYFIKDITEFRYRQINKALLDSKLGNGNVFLVKFMSPSQRVVIAQGISDTYIVGGTTELQSMILNIINGNFITYQNFVNQKNPYRLNNVIMTNLDAVIIGETRVYRTYNRTFMIRIPYQGLF